MGGGWVGVGGWVGGEGGGGERLQYKMPRCVCLVSENRPILNVTLSCKTYPY